MAFARGSRGYGMARMTDFAREHGARLYVLGGDQFQDGIGTHGVHHALQLKAAF